MPTVYLALGSNLGDRRANLREALRRLAPLVTVEAVSKLYESPPQPPAPPPSFYNAACRVMTALEPEALLRHVKAIEAAMGRTDTGYWGPRPIDIDIALYEDRVIERETLTVPHVRLTQRAFVLRPILDLEPDLTDPRDYHRLQDDLARVGDGGLVCVEATGWHNDDEMGDGALSSTLEG